MCWHQKSCTSTWKSWFPALCHRGPPKKISAIPNWGLSTPIWHQKISVGTGINSTQKAVAAKTCGPPWWIFVAGMHQQSENVESKVSGIGSFALPPRCQGRLPLVPFFEIITDHVYIYIYMQAYVYTYLSCKLDCVHVPVYNHVIRVYCILCIYIYTHSFSCISCYVHIGINRIIDTFATTYSVLLAGSFKQLH